jgi:hypothetical protein
MPSSHFIHNQIEKKIERFSRQKNRNAANNQQQSAVIA